MSDQVQLGIITLVGTMFASVMSYLTYRIQQQGAAAARKVAEVAAKLGESDHMLAGLVETTDATHKIVNSQRTEMQAEIKSLSDALREALKTLAHERGTKSDNGGE